MPSSGALGNTVKLVGEVVMTGTSELVDGNIKSGSGHILLGAVGSALLGPLGLLLVKANSFSHSVSEKHLHQHIGNLFSGGQAAAEEAPAADA